MFCNLTYFQFFTKSNIWYWTCRHVHGSSPYQIFSHFIDHCRQTRNKIQVSHSCYFVVSHFAKYHLQKNCVFFRCISIHNLWTLD
jgi:hypothetical protein